MISSNACISEVASSTANRKIHWDFEPKVINFRGRFEYLEATLTHWPKLVSSLPFDTIPHAGSEWPGSLAELTQLPEFDEIRGAILEWAKQHNIKDAWILDAAVQTVSKGSPYKRWHYIPAELPIQEFAVAFGTWIPLPGIGSRPVSWWEFNKTATATFNRRRKEYHRAVEKTWGVERPSLVQHAGWMVMWQKGKSAEQIRLHEIRRGKSAVTDTNILVNVSRFAEEIGLTRRETRSRPARRT